ncbi:MAG: SAM-dependent methyltransferase [Rubrivivax sp.]|nr:SAM-dependent methyltransferase [Rubrivivax sp.]
MPRVNRLSPPGRDAPGLADIAGRELSALLQQRVLAAIAGAGGWLPFDRYMAMALYEPGLGYYARGAPLFGTGPAGGSDFVTAPELSPLFGAALAAQVAEVLRLAALDEVIEFGAGSGALAAQVLGALAARGIALRRYTIVELPGALRARQQQRLAGFGDTVRWLDRWPPAIEAVVIGNEVLDAMPVKLLRFDGQAWLERGVIAAAAASTAAEPMPVHPPHRQGERAVDDGASPAGPGAAVVPVGLAFAERPTALRPPLAEQALPGATVEIHPQAEAFVATLAARLARGAAFFIDYGFPEAEYYHPQRHQGTLMCHRAHRADIDPLAEPGTKDITAHLNFTALALAAQEVGAEVVGYTSQARFLMNCGLLERLHGADARTLAPAHKLLAEHEMGELFKVLAFARGVRFGPAGPLGFRAGDRTHML